MKISSNNCISLFESLEGSVTVGQLRSILAQYPSDMIVVKPGYEGGYDDFRTNPRIVKVVETKGGRSYEGKYQDASDVAMAKGRSSDYYGDVEG